MRNPVHPGKGFNGKARSRRFQPIRCAAALLVGAVCLAARADVPTPLNREIRRVLSENCFACHGPDANHRKGGQDGLRLDIEEGSRADLGGYSAVIPGHPEKSELIRRITTQDPDDQMPPPDSGKKLTQTEKDLLREWIKQGASYTRHWAYVQPARPALPEVRLKDWPRNAIDYFILAKLESEGLSPSPEADRAGLARRAALDVTGLPPSVEEADAFLQDPLSGAYERWLDRLLEKESYGEHWARLWLDQARYADSTGYADDPPRTIWGYRDYVIRSLNANKPYDQFTLEQIAGDLLPEPTEEQLVATAFHRNTQTNNEGGTNDEEYRNVSVVDRVNTTMAVWMGTTMACAQCHDHKYDPFSQQDYFRLFAILNNTEDADRKDEDPVLTLYTANQKQKRNALREEIETLERTLSTRTPELAEAQTAWEHALATPPVWDVVRPEQVKSRAGAPVTSTEDGIVRVGTAGPTDAYTIEIPWDNPATVTALRLETLPDDTLPAGGPGHAGGNFVLSRVLATVTPPEVRHPQGRYLRIDLPGKDRILSLAEVEVFAGANNVARLGEAAQSSTDYNGSANLAIDGNTDGDYAKSMSTTHTALSENPWWELDLKSTVAVDRVVLWNRTDNNLQNRLADFQVSLLDADHKPAWKLKVQEPPSPNSEFSLSGARTVSWTGAFADYEQKGFTAASLLEGKVDPEKGWAVGGAIGQTHQLILVPETPLLLESGSRLSIVLEQLSKFENHTLGKFRWSATTDSSAAAYARIPADVLTVLKTPASERDANSQEKLADYYLSITPALESERTRLAGLRKQLEAMKPYTTVPIMRELPTDRRRATHVQRRGNFLDLGPEVSEGLPSSLFPATADAEPVNRLTLARWLVDDTNPLTARVTVNRLWGAIFGQGIVRTSEEFGAQGEPPSHPELLDWLAVELVSSGWNLKHILKLMVASAAYRQSSRVTPELEAVDPENRLLARGPRFRLSAEMIRDQAMFASGLLSSKMYGPPVRPPQPQTGLSAAFGGGIDWETSKGEDRYRRALYTTWRRSNPYPSMTTFDAPNREVCTVRRERTNTPLQALVTLNDPVYIEAAQALARRMVLAGPVPADVARTGFRLCLIRPPQEPELRRLTDLYETLYAEFSNKPVQARLLATQPLGPVPEGANETALAAWTVVANVLLNLDETLMKR